MKSKICSLLSLRRVLPLLVFLVGVAFTSGCANYQVRMPDDDPINKPYEGGMMHAYVGGLWYSPQVMTADCATKAINDVVVKRNYLYDLASVLTLGLWMPIEIEYRCAAPKGIIDIFPDAPPGARN
jgi:hypothetical protein